jgi:hypothetical protein
MSRPDLELVNDRMKLIMDRLIARRIRRDPELVQRAYDWLCETRAAAGDKPQWWMDEWLEVLGRGDDEVRSFIVSRDQYARQMANASPLYCEPAIGDMFHDLQLRKRILSKARNGLILHDERQELREEQLHDRASNCC